MAIKKAIDHKGLPAPEAYLRIENISGSKKKGWHVQYSTFASAAAANPPAVRNGWQQRVLDGKPVVDADDKPVMDPIMRAPEAQALDGAAFMMPYAKGVDLYEQAYAELKKQIGGGEDC